MVRHAPVIGKDGYIYGDEADIDLISTKPRLAELSDLLPNISEAIWYYSGVDRAHKTAKAILNYRTEISSFDFLSIAPGFREQDFGSLIGKSHADVTEHLKFVDGKIYAPSPPDGESIDRFIHRVGEAILSLKKDAAKHSINEVVVVCHGGTIRAANAFIHNLGIDGFLDIETKPLHLEIFRNI